MAESHELTGAERMLSASVGALLTSLSVTPFDVVKVCEWNSAFQTFVPQVRMQSQRKTGPMQPVCAGGTPLQNCSHFQLHTGLIDVWCRKCDLPRPTPNMHFTGPI